MNFINERNKYIDFVKYVASILIIAIHTSLFKDYNEILYFAFVNVICRLAVPFFAISTGYFMTRKFDLAKGKKDKKSIFIKQWKKLFLIYLIWSIVYLIKLVPMWLEIDWFSFRAFVDFGFAFLFSKPFYHMWYILSVLYALPLFFICLRVLNKKFYIWLAGCLWIIKVLIYGYSQWIFSSFTEILQIFEIFSGIRDGIFCILPLMLLGAYVYYQKDRKKTFYLISFIIFSILHFIEAFALQYCGQENVSFIIFVFPTSYSLFNLILNFKIGIKEQWCKILGGASLFIYLVHPLVLELFVNVVQNSIFCFILTAIVSTILGIIYAKIKDCLKSYDYV